MSKNEMTLSPEEQARGYIYTLLATLLASPADVPILGIMQRIEPDIDAQDKAMTEAWSRLQITARDSDVNRLREDYDDLFNKKNGGKLSPYASQYQNACFSGESLSGLRHNLADLGINLKDRSEDHVATLCQAMGQSISQNLFSFASQRTFFKTYIAPWMLNFFSELSNAQSTGLYHAVGRLGVCFLGRENEYFKVDN